MINRILTFIIILSFGSFLLSGEATKISSKESREFMDDNNWTCDNHEQIEYELGLEAGNAS